MSPFRSNVAHWIFSSEKFIHVLIFLSMSSKSWMLRRYISNLLISFIRAEISRLLGNWALSNFMYLWIVVKLLFWRFYNIIICYLKSFQADSRFLSSSLIVLSSSWLLLLTSWSWTFVMVSKSLMISFRSSLLATVFSLRQWQRFSSRYGVSRRGFFDDDSFYDFFGFVVGLTVRCRFCFSVVSVGYLGHIKS